MSAPVTLPLSQPIQAHGETRASLVFRAPTGGDMRRNGLPFSLAGASVGEMNTASIALYIQDLAGIPMPSVDTLSPFDFVAATGVIVGFFQPAAPVKAAPVSSTPPSFSPSITAAPAGGGTIAASLG